MENVPQNIVPPAVQPATSMPMSRGWFKAYWFAFIGIVAGWALLIFGLLTWPFGSSANVKWLWVIAVFATLVLVNLLIAHLIYKGLKRGSRVAKGFVVLGCVLSGIVAFYILLLLVGIIRRLLIGNT